MSSDLIAVPDMGAAPCGSVTWWRLSGTISYLELCQHWAEADLNVEDLPAPPSEHVALRRALDEYAGPHTSIVTLPQGSGFAIVDETFAPPTEDEEKPTPVYTTRCKVWVGDKGLIVGKGDAFSSHDSAQRETMRKELLAAIRVTQFELNNGDVGSWLVSRVADLNAIRLRDTGGIYFVPQNHRDEWSKIAAVLEKCAQSRIWQIPALRANEAVGAILEALRQQANNELAKIEAALERELGAKGLRTQQALAQEQLALLSSYEQLLGVTQQDLREKIQAVEARVVEAVLTAEMGES